MEKQSIKHGRIMLWSMIFAILLIVVVGITYAFFNYTRTGITNTIKVGRIAFNSTQNNTINLTNVFPIASNEASGENDNYDEIEITITGDTTYSQGIEYLVTTVDVNNEVNNKEIPIAIEVEGSNGLGNRDASYFDNRGGQSSEYKVLSKGTVKEDGQILVGYIANGQTGVNGTVTIKAYIDKNSIAISDTYPSEDVTHIESSGETSVEVLDYTNGTPDEWVNGRVVLTTQEWNNLHNSSLSFKVKVEANEGIWVEEPLTGVQKVQRAIAAKINAETNSCNPIWTDTEDGIIYFSGTNDCVDMNYVWYSGKLWRITAIYPDGAMKLVTQNNITSIAFNESGKVNFYTDANTTSWMYQWLNEDFYVTLYNPNDFIDTTKQWNATSSNDDATIRLAKTNMVIANVGLLNSYDLYNTYRCISSPTCIGTTFNTGYLIINYYWWLLNPKNSTDVWYALNGGAAYGNGPIEAYGVRPSIVIKAGLEFTGDGTSSNPYRIVGDKDTGKVNELINTRLSGEYVKLKSGNNEQLFRIIGVEDNKTKIIAMNYADGNSRKFSTNNNDILWGSGTTTDANTWYTYLNTPTTGYLDRLKSTYGEFFDSGLYYFGTSGRNYKLSVCVNTTSGSTTVCDKTNDKGVFNVGLPRYGEVFSTQPGLAYALAMSLMNGYNSSKIWKVNTYGKADYGNATQSASTRPTLHLKSTVKILSGSGTETDPYVVGL